MENIFELKEIKENLSKALNSFIEANGSLDELYIKHEAELIRRNEQKTLPP